MSYTLIRPHTPVLGTTHGWGPYQPIADLLPEKAAERRAGGRERSRKYYAKRRAIRDEQRNAEMYGGQTFAHCIGCQAEIALLCGFCEEGI